MAIHRRVNPSRRSLTSSPPHLERTAYGCFVSDLTRFTGPHYGGCSSETGASVNSLSPAAGPCQVARAIGAGVIPGRTLGGERKQKLDCQKCRVLYCRLDLRLFLRAGSDESSGPIHLVVTDLMRELFSDCPNGVGWLHCQFGPCPSTHLSDRQPLPVQPSRCDQLGAAAAGRSGAGWVEVNGPFRHLAKGVMQDVRSHPPCRRDGRAAQRHRAALRRSQL